MTTTYRLGPVAKQVLNAISKAPKGLSTDAVGAYGFYDDPRGHVHALESLSTAGLITFMGTLKVWRITRPGASQLSRATVKDPAAPGIKAEPRRMVPSGTYTGQELTRNPPRTGSADAYRIPSVFLGQRVPTSAALRAQGGAA